MSGCNHIRVYCAPTVNECEIYIFLQASAVTAKPYLRHRGLAKTSKQKNALETNLLKAVQSKGKYCHETYECMHVVSM